MAAMDVEMAQHTASHVAGAFELYLEMGNWLWAAYMNSSEEEKAGWREDKEFLMMLKLKPEDVKHWGGKDDMDMKDMDMKDKPESLMSGPPSLRKLFKF
jgi:hypothetical protein